ncbi:MAG: hypothetical protein ACRD0F_08100, partial [Acidimicrobiales bacterium]
FDEAGFWEVTVTAEIGGNRAGATSAFEVLGRHQLPAVGDAAPRTVNLRAGDAGVNPKAVDSRAGPDGAVPDPALHRTTAADAMAAGLPVLVVVATPVYCQSRFCGPITDAVEELANQYQGRLAGVHIEVWEDFEAGRVNPTAREWISPKDGSETREPWIYLVGRDGRVAARWDNVATEEEMATAVRRVVG